MGNILSSSSPQQKILLCIKQGKLADIENHLKGKDKRSKGKPLDIHELSTCYTCYCGKHTPDDFSLIHFASSNADPITVMWLSKHNADMQQITESGYTPLILAVLHGNEDNILPLCMLKCDKDAVDNTEFGNTALHYSCLYGHVNIVKQLLELKADINIKNKLGQKPIDLAKDRKNCDLLEERKRQETMDPPKIKEELDGMKQSLKNIEKQLTGKQQTHEPNSSKASAGNRKKFTKLAPVYSDSSPSEAESTSSYSVKPIPETTVDVINQQNLNDSGVDIAGSMHHGNFSLHNYSALQGRRLGHQLYDRTKAASTMCLTERINHK